MSVPRNDSERLELLGSRPPAWEYQLFGAALLSALHRTAPSRSGAPILSGTQRSPDLPWTTIGSRTPWATRCLAERSWLRLWSE